MRALTNFEEVYAVYFDDVYRYLLSLSGSESVAEESHEEELEDHSEAARIQELLHALREPYKEVFMWRVYGEKSFRDIGALFGKTENWACVTYHRAKRMIREGLEDD